MSRRFVLTLVLFCITFSISAQDQTMTADQKKAYDQGRLYVDAIPSIRIGFGFMSLDANHQWSARKGLEELAESMFYEVAGFSSESKKAAEFKNFGWSLLFGGGAMFVGGMAWMTLGVTNTNYLDPNYLTNMQISLYGGTAVALLGIIPFYIGLDRVQKNWSTVQQAQMAADEYNGKLADKITAE